MAAFIKLYRWVIAFLIMTITGAVSLILVLISFGFLRNFCVKYIIKYSSRLILRSIGFIGVFPDPSQLPNYPVMYTFNHNSFLDIFLLTGMGLTNTRIILSESTLKYIPLVISAKAVGTFYIPMQEKHERRLKFFKRITEFLKNSKYSIMASSEGYHRHFHGIAPFNRGVYHMALEAKLPIVALYIHIPEQSNVNVNDNAAVGGEVRIEYLKEFDTKDWQLDNLREHIEEVRNTFVQRFEELNPDLDSN